jgi:hypothetical protein
MNPVQQTTVNHLDAAIQDLMKHELSGENLGSFLHLLCLCAGFIIGFMRSAGGNNFTSEEQEILITHMRNTIASAADRMATEGKQASWH